MINSLYGVSTVVEPHRVSLRSEGGIEWDIAVSSHTIRYLERHTQPLRLYTHLHHKDDTHQLFGFATIQERHLFRDLLRVNGIGPRHAIQILSHLEVAQIVEEIAQGNYQLLRSVPGIGEKSAQRIVLTLKGSVALHEEGPVSDIEQALIGMGYQRAAVQRVVGHIMGTLRMQDYKSQTDYESEIMRRAVQELRS